MNEQTPSKKPGFLKKAKKFLYGKDIQEIDVGAGSSNKNFEEDWAGFEEEYPEDAHAMQGFLEERDDLDNAAWDEEDDDKNEKENAEDIITAVKKSAEGKAATDLTSAFNYLPLTPFKTARFNISLAFNKYKQKKAEKKGEKWEESTEIVPGVELGRIPEDIQKLIDRGITLIVGCIDAGELSLVKFLMSKLGNKIKQVFIPMEDFGAEVNHDLAIMGIREMKAARAKGEKVYVHCKAGRARSLMELCCYLLEDIENIPEFKNFFLSDKSGLSQADSIQIFHHLTKGTANEAELDAAFNAAVKFVQTKRPQVEISRAKKAAGIAILQKYFKQENDLKNGVTSLETTYTTKCELSQLPALKELGLYKIALGKLSTKYNIVGDLYEKLQKYEDTPAHKKSLEKSLSKLIASAQKSKNFNYQMLVKDFLESFFKFTNDKKLDISNDQLIQSAAQLTGQVTLATSILKTMPSVLKDAVLAKGIRTNQITPETEDKIKKLFSENIEFDDIKLKYQEFLKLEIGNDVKDAFLAAIAPQVNKPTLEKEGEKVENREAVQILTDYLKNLEKYHEYLIAAKNYMLKNKKDADVTAIDSKISDASNEIQKRKAQKSQTIDKIKMIDSGKLEKFKKFEAEKSKENILTITGKTKSEEKELPVDFVDEKPKTYVYAQDKFIEINELEDLTGKEPMVEKYQHQNKYVFHPAPLEHTEVNEEALRKTLRDFIQHNEGKIHTAEHIKFSPKEGKLCDLAKKICGELLDEALDTKKETTVLKGVSLSMDDGSPHLQK